MQGKRERRFGLLPEVRATADTAEAGNTVHIEGYAAVFNQPAEIGDYFVEVIAPGAFDGCDLSDVIFNINHEGLPLARTASGTLDLTVDKKGLKVASDLLADDPDVQRIVPKMKRGDLSKMSLCFSVLKEEWDETGEDPVRTILKFEKIYDVSIVNDPAYEGTEIGLRSLEAHRAKAQARAKNHHAARRRRMQLDLAKARCAGGER